MESCANRTFNLLKARQTVFHSGCAFVHSCRPRTRLQLLPALADASFLLVSFSHCCRRRDVWVGVSWYLTVALICVSLLASGTDHLARGASSLTRCLFRPFAHLELGSLSCCRMQGFLICSGHELWSDIQLGGGRRRKPPQGDQKCERKALGGAELSLRGCAGRSAQPGGPQPRGTQGPAEMRLQVPSGTGDGLDLPTFCPGNVLSAWHLAQVLALGRPPKGPGKVSQQVTPWREGPNVKGVALLALGEAGLPQRGEAGLPQRGEAGPAQG